MAMAASCSFFTTQLTGNDCRKGNRALKKYSTETHHWESYVKFSPDSSSTEILSQEADVESHQDAYTVARTLSHLTPISRATY